jgi:hypothetical protein
MAELASNGIRLGFQVDKNRTAAEMLVKPDSRIISSTEDSHNTFALLSLRATTLL